MFSPKIYFLLFAVSTFIVLVIFYSSADKASNERIATQEDVYHAAFCAAAVLVEFTATLFAASQLDSPKYPPGRGDLG